MRKFFSILMIFCIVLLVGCERERPEVIDNPGDEVEFFNGAVTVNNTPTMEVVNVGTYPKAELVGLGARSGDISRADVEPEPDNNYVFRHILSSPAISVVADGVRINTQASHVKIAEADDAGGYVFVSYNRQYDGNYGGVALFRYTYTGDRDRPVSLAGHALLEMKSQDVSFQVNAIDYHDRKLYVAGATDEPGWFGFEDEKTPALFMVVELGSDMKFRVSAEPKIIQLGSYQTTSIRRYEDKIYVTSGDNAKDGPALTSGGLYVFNANTLVEEKFVELDDVRSVDVDPSGVFVMQGPTATVSRFNFDGSFAADVYYSDESIQKDAKSDLFAWNNFLFLAQNQTGMKMISKSGALTVGLPPPNREYADCRASNVDNLDCWFYREDVTNSMSVNSYPKKPYFTNGTQGSEDIQSDLLLLANGRQGLYWYEIIGSGNNRELAGRNASRIFRGDASANNVEARGNVVFLANGTAGLRVLFIEFEEDCDCSDPDEVDVVFVGIIDEDGEKIPCDGLPALKVELDKEIDIDWDAIFEAYKELCFDVEEEWVIEWEVGGKRVPGGRRPKITFTEDMVEDGEIPVYAVIVKPKAKVKFVGVIEDDKDYECTGLPSFTVELNKNDVIDWELVYARYNQQACPIAFNEEWVLGWEIVDAQRVDGKRPAISFTKEMMDANDEILVYAVIKRPVAKIIFNGLFNDISGLRTITPAIYTLEEEVVLGVEAEIDWEEVFESYEGYPWADFEYNVEWVTGWINGSQNRFPGETPAIIFTEAMLDAESAENVIYVQAIINPPSAKVVFKGLNYASSTVFVEISGLYSQIVQLDKPNELNWDDVFESYSSRQDLPTAFIENRITGWISSTEHTFDGAKPDDIYFTDDMFDAVNTDEIHMYVIIRPYVYVSFSGYMDAQGNVLQSVPVNLRPFEFGVAPINWNYVFEDYSTVYAGIEGFNTDMITGWRILGAASEYSFDQREPTITLTEYMRNVQIWNRQTAYIVTIYAVIGQ